MANSSLSVFVCADITNQSQFFSAESSSQCSATSIHFPSEKLKPIFSTCLNALLSVKMQIFEEEYKFKLSITDNEMLKKLASSLSSSIRGKNSRAPEYREDRQRNLGVP